MAIGRSNELPQSGDCEISKPGEHATCSPDHPITRSPGRFIFRRATHELVAVLILIAALPYLNSLFNGFVQDDNRQVVTNPYLRSFSHLREIFATNVWSYVGAQGMTNYYRPLMTFGYLLCYQLLGPLAYGFHLANIILNAAVVGLVFLVTQRIFKDRTLGLAAAVIFALHPIHSESVDWIAAVTDLQLALFYLLAFWFFLRLAKPGGGRSAPAELGMVLSFVAALLAKEPAATLPVVATFFEHFLREDRAQTSFRQKLSRYLSLWLLDAAYLLFRIRIFGGLAPVLQLPQISRREAFYSAFALVAQYVWKFIWPVNLCGFYTFHKNATPADPRVIAGFLVLATSLAVFLLCLRRMRCSPPHLRSGQEGVGQGFEPPSQPTSGPLGIQGGESQGARVVSFGLLWFFLNIAPVLNARWLGANVFTERYLYLPSLGFCWITAWGGLLIWRRLTGRPTVRKLFVAGLATVAVLCVVRIITRNRIWHDDATFYRRTLAAQPDAIALRINLGAVYWNLGFPDQAEVEWREALRRAPNQWLVLNNLGLAAARKKQYGEAIDDFQRSIRQRPNYADSHMNLGRTYAETGEPELAEAQLRAAVALAPLYVPARNELAKFYFDNGRFVEAEKQFHSSISSGGTTQAWNSLGEIYCAWKRWQDAEYAFRQAVALDPFNSAARFGLGAVLEAENRPAEALNEYTAGLQTDPRNSEALEAVKRLRNLLHGPPP